MLQQHVGHRAVLVQGLGRHHGDVLHGEAYDGAQVRQVAAGRHLGTDDDVRSHGPGDIDREIVAGSAVAQHHAFRAYGPEIDRDGHGGTHGVDHVAGGPVLLLHGMHVRRDAIEGDGEGVEGEGVLVADRNGAQRVPHIEAEQVTVRHAETELAHHLVHHVAGAVVPLLESLPEPELPLCPGLLVDIFIVPGNRDGEALLVAPHLVGLVAVGNLVGHHDRPVDGPDQRIQVTLSVPQ